MRWDDAVARGQAIVQWDPPIPSLQCRLVRNSRSGTHLARRKQWASGFFEPFTLGAFGCGRWARALTEPSRSYVRSLTRAPLARSVLLRLVLLRDPAQPCAQEREVCPEARETS